MKKTFITKFNRLDGMSWIWAVGSRAALLLTAVVLLIMPFTEYLWNFDKFLRGGQDFEFGLLSVATILCLVMIQIQHGKCSVNLLLSLRRWFSKVFLTDDHTAPGSFMGLIAALHAITVPSPSLSQYTPPLQV